MPAPFASEPACAVSERVSGLACGGSERACEGHWLVDRPGLDRVTVDRAVADEERERFHSMEEKRRAQHREVGHVEAPL
eukprot:5315172-Prymnesium_polylepis.1